MLERIYVDNYKCLVNFEYRPEPLQLLLGANGSGKSTVFEVLGLLRAFIVEGQKTSDLFDSRSLTRWQRRNEQTFEIEVSGDGSTCRYRLVVEHQANGRSETPRSRVTREELRFDNREVFVSEYGLAQSIAVVGDAATTAYLVDQERSGVSLLSQRSEDRRIAWFIEWISRLYRIQINPYAMTSASSREQLHPSPDLADYASWYRHLLQEQPNVADGLKQYIREVIGGFDTFVLSKEGETTRLLRASIRNGREAPHLYGFGELSEGQRVLICLYTLLALMKETPITLCIDEPDNFVMLREIQPWLRELREQTEDRDSQALVISHHPEIIDYLTPHGAVHFSRLPEGPVRVKPFVVGEEVGLPASEIVARGWEDDG